MRILKVSILLLSGCANQNPTTLINGNKVYPPLGCIGHKDICLIEPIFNDLKERWVFKKDIELYKVNDYWATSQESESNNLSGDCEDFAIYLRNKLSQLGIKSRLVFVKVNGGGHIIVITEKGYILDNLQKYIVVKGVLRNYTFVSQSGFNVGEPWYEVYN